MLRILPVLALLPLVAVGCGGAARPGTVANPGVPRPLAQAWEGQARAIAAAAAAGNECRAKRLADRLHHDVSSASHRLPFRLRAPLLTGVSALVARTSCTPVSTEPAAPVPPPEHPQKPKPPPGEQHGPPGHEKDNGKGHGKDHGKGHEK